MRSRLALLALFVAAALSAHVGSPDVYLDAKAGPYQLFITVQPPTVIPGVAQLEIRTDASGITSVTAAPLAITGDGAKYAPIADRMQPSKDDPKFFTGGIWLMRSGSFEARVTVDGPLGKGVVNVPIPALAKGTKPMQAGLGIALFALMCLLVAGMVSIAGAAVRDAPLEPGVQPTNAQRKRGRFVMLGVLVFLIGVVWFGNRWWGSEARAYGNYIYKPLGMSATLGQGQLLTLHISDPGWLKARKTDDFIPDHGHLMHLYMLHEPDQKTVYHLHPELGAPGSFQLELPSMPDGRYNLYADVVHEDGFPETMTASINVPRVEGRALAGDDAVGSGEAASTEFTLPDGYRMMFENGGKTFRAKQAQLFRFKLVDANGAPPKDMAFYMGMVGHAAFVKTDGSVFAHIHPNGTVAMAAYMLGNKMDMSGNEMAGMQMGIPNAVSFPYGFPVPGDYRIFVQMKHGGMVETGLFRATVQ